MDSRSPFCVGPNLQWVRVKHLGEGTYGFVDLVKIIKPVSRLLAIKSSPSPSPSIKKEFRILRTFFGCPNIIKCYDSFTTLEHKEEYDNLFLEYASGGTLLDLIHKSGGKIPEYDVRRYTKMILQGLHCIHARDYVHCDLKPENILVCPSEFKPGSLHLKLADFGLAKEPGDRVPVSSGYCFRGTPLYMSPESVKNGEITAALDIWSLGCVIVKMMTGETPWESDVDGLEDLANRICHTRDIPDIPRGISASGKDFLMRCFARDPCQRWTADILLRHPFIFTGEYPLRAVAPPLLPHEIMQKFIPIASNRQPRPSVKVCLKVQSSKLKALLGLEK